MSTVLCIVSVKDDKDTFGPSVPSILPMHIYFVIRFLDVTKPKKKPYKHLRFRWRFKHGFELDPPIPLPSGVGQYLAYEKCKKLSLCVERADVVNEIMQRFCKLLANDPAPGYCCCFIVG